MTTVAWIDDNDVLSAKFANLFSFERIDRRFSGLFDSGGEHQSLGEACGRQQTSRRDRNGSPPETSIDRRSPPDAAFLSASRNRDDLCSRVLAISQDAVSDEDLLALLLSYAKNEVSSRTLATKLISRFETLGSVFSARSEQISGAVDVDTDVIDFLRAIRAAGTRLAREEISERPVLDAWEKLLAYLRTAMAHEMVEQFRVLFLDRCNVLIADEVQHIGTIDHTPVYPREIVKRALALDASAIIMVHNHPSNHPAPSKPDIAMTMLIRDTVEPLGIVLHDHIIVSRRGHTSFRAMGLLDGERSSGSGVRHRPSSPRRT